MDEDDLKIYEQFLAQNKKQQQEHHQLAAMMDQIGKQPGVGGH